MRVLVSFVARVIALAVALFLHTAVVVAQFPTSVLIDYLTVARQSVFFTSGNSCPTYSTWSTQTCTAFGSNTYGTVANVAPITSAVDNNAATIAHTDGGTGAGVITAMYMLLDLQEPRLITTVGLLSRSDCCFNREGGWGITRGGRPRHPCFARSAQIMRLSFLQTRRPSRRRSQAPRPASTRVRVQACRRGETTLAPTARQGASSTSPCSALRLRHVLRSTRRKSGLMARYRLVRWICSGEGTLLRMYATLDVSPCRPSHHDSHRLFDDDVYAELWVQPG